jgi:hypothetical protein
MRGPILPNPRWPESPPSLIFLTTRRTIALLCALLTPAPALADDGCHNAKEQAAVADQALKDGLSIDAGNATNASRILTSRPTLEQLWDEFDDAVAQVGRACRGEEATK